MNQFPVWQPIFLQATQFDRPAQCVRWLALAIVFSLLGTNYAWTDHDTVREELPNGWRHDAELNDVFFLDTQHGWAVGAQGTILKTDNGGLDWQEISQVRNIVKDQMLLEQKVRDLQSGRSTTATGVSGSNSMNRPLRCRFESVYFVDEKHGWIAGGYRLPYINRSRAVLLTTRDGGKTWTSAENLMVSSLRKIKFHDSQSGWAVGDSGHLLGSGLYATSNGGQSWSAETGQQAAGWRAALPTERGFVTLNRQGIPGRFLGPNYEAAPLIDLSEDAAFHAMAAVDTQHLVAVGPSGSVAQSKNQGESWRPIESQGLPQWLVQFDLRTVAVVGDTIWFAGDPGTQLFAFDRVSGNVRQVNTPVTARINQIRFLGQEHGWAVGENGTILATSDGGKTWQRQRGQTRSLAALFIAPQADQVPLGLISLYATEENRRCGVTVLAATPDQFDAVTQAVDRLGASHVSLVDLEWESNPQQDAAGQRTRRLRRLVRIIRSQQPAVIVCNSSSYWNAPSGWAEHDPTSQVQEAIRLAADPRAFPDQVQHTGLAAHQVARFVVRDPAGQMTISPSRLLPRTGSLIEDQVGLSRALLGLAVNVNQPTSYREVPLNQVSPMRNDDLFSGLAASRAPLRSGNQFRRGSVAEIKSANQRSSKLKEFSRFEVHSPNDLLVWRRNVESYAMPLEPMVGAHWMMRLHQRYRELGKIELAALSAELLATRWSNSPYVPSCLMWLGQLYASDEFGKLMLRSETAAGRRQLDGRQTEESRMAGQYTTTPQRQRVNGVDVLVWTPTQNTSDANDRNPDNSEKDIELVDHQETDSSELPSIRSEWFFERGRKAARILTAIEQLDPDFASSVEVQWMKARLSKQLVGLPGVTNDTFRNRLKNLIQTTTEQSNNVMLTADRKQRCQQFRLAAATELAIVDSENARPPNNELPRQLHGLDLIEGVALAASKPTLDGSLNEPVWNSTRRFKTGENFLAVAVDKEYLYLAVKCNKLPKVSYQWDGQPRPRDADLARRDRVLIELDVDRDYLSAFELEMDHRGWAGERCHGLPGWNPDWFVAQAETDQHWIIEAAIPLVEIAVQRPNPESPWAIKVTRRFGDTTTGSNSVSDGFVPQAEGYQLLKFPAF